MEPTYLEITILVGITQLMIASIENGNANPIIKTPKHS